MYARGTKVFVGVLAIAFFALIGLQAWARTAQAPGDIGPAGDRLRSCGSSSHCVSSESTAGGTPVEPLTCGLVGGEALLALARDALAALPNTVIEDETSEWVHGVAQNPLLGFRDDIELLLGPGGRVVHVRSESRIGLGNIGDANRQHVGDLRTELASRC